MITEALPQNISQSFVSIWNKLRAIEARFPPKIKNSVRKMKMTGSYKNKMYLKYFAM